jgi:phosphorylcholine metabolism protein LicD
MIKNHYSFSRICSIIFGIFIIIAALYYAYNEYWPHQCVSKEMSKEEFNSYKISENKALALYQLMSDVHEILEKHKITYWIHSGTLLGAVRHSGLIPFDDDLDISMLHEDEIKLQDALEELRVYGYQIRHSKIYAVCKKLSCLDNACIDIFITHNYNDKILYTNLEIRKKFPNDYFFKDEIFPLKKYKFGELELYGPNNANNALDRQYPEWNKYIIIQQHHTYSSWISKKVKKTKFIISHELSQPAMPIGPLLKEIK